MDANAGGAILYEYPFNERVRTLLRLEDLFDKLRWFCGQEHPYCHHTALLTLFEIMEVAGRADIKSELMQELERQKQSLNALVDVVTQRSADLTALTGAAEAGRLSVRADTSKYVGYNGRMLDAINKLMDRLVAPLQLAAGYMERIARGEVPPRIQEEWNGDLEQVRRTGALAREGLERLARDYRGLLQPVRGIRVEDERTLSIELSRPVAEISR